MGHEIRPDDPALFSQGAVGATSVEMADYIHGMLEGLHKMTIQPRAKTLRTILWLAKTEAQRILREAELAAPCGEPISWKKSTSGGRPKS